jgi:diguanylate cyclase (GGDEF)-like protein
MGQIIGRLRRSCNFVWSSDRDQEREQASLRVVLGAIVLGIYGVFAWFHPSGQARIAVILLASYVVYGGFTWLVVTRMARPSRIRLAVTTLLDQALIGSLLATGPVALPMIWAIFWFLTGAGCRFGKPALALSCAAALGSITLLATLQPWWMVNRAVALGLALSAIAMSVYLGLLVDRLDTVVRQLARQVGTDPLTGLSNRVALQESIDHAMSTSTRGRSDPEISALMLIDLNGFKEVNDTYGHAVGDVLLQTFAGLLELRMRATDTVARLGGDEFVVLVRHVENKDEVLAIAEGIHSVLASMTSIQGQSVKVSASIGACMLSERSNIGALMHAADEAMYQAKALGLGRTVFSDEMIFDTE